MKVINIQNAKTHLSRLVEESVMGEDIVIAKAGKPLVRLVPFREEAELRKLGMLAGQVKESADCWEHDPEMESLFYDTGDSETLRVAEDAP
jgi:prevent-host-death family protein